MSDPVIGCIGIGPQHIPCPHRLRCESHWVLRRAGSVDIDRVWHLCQTDDYKTPDYERFVEVRYGAV